MDVWISFFVDDDDFCSARPRLIALFGYSDGNEEEPLEPLVTPEQESISRCVRYSCICLLSLLIKELSDFAEDLLVQELENNE